MTDDERLREVLLDLLDYLEDVKQDTDMSTRGKQGFDLARHHVESVTVDLLADCECEDGIPTAEKLQSKGWVCFECDKWVGEALVRDDADDEQGGDDGAD